MWFSPNPNPNPNLNLNPNPGPNPGPNPNPNPNSNPNPSLYPNQVWFDTGGVVGSMFFALIGSICSFAIAQLLPATTVIQRYVFALTADSQLKLNALWYAQP